MVQNKGLDEFLKYMWILDSDATAHMVNMTVGMYSVSEWNEPIEYSKVERNSMSNFKCMIDMNIKICNGKFRKLTLKCIYYIEYLFYNVISISS